MSIIPWKQKEGEGELSEAKPWSGTLEQFSREMDRMCERFFRDPWSSLSGSAWTPAVDIAENDQEVTVRVELPGMKPDDVDISISGDLLTIAGEKKAFEEKRGKDFHHSESFFGKFQRRVPLPTSVDSERVTAEHNHGVITIHLPKQESVKPKRIEIKAT